MESTAHIIKVDCIDEDTISDIRTALITAEANLESFARRSTNEDKENAYITKAKRMHIIQNEIKKIIPCI